jgi:hypothetical protein
MGVFGGHRIQWIGCHGGTQVASLAIEPAQHGVGQLARAQSVTLFGEFHGLCDRGVWRYATHVDQLLGSKAQEVRQVRIEPREPPADAFAQEQVEPRAATQEAVYEFLRPSSVTAVE